MEKLENKTMNLNALQYIDRMLKDESIVNHDAKSAYNQFIAEGGTGTYDYFRTKFNKAKPKPTVPNAILPATEIKSVERIIEEDLPTLNSKNYMTGDELPELAGLIPTGTLFDELISDRITLDEELEEYLSDHGIEMPFTEGRERGGFTRKCVDIIAGAAGTGKTWSRCMLAVKAKLWAKENLDKDLRIGFISGEMRESEWAKELNGSPLLKNLEVEFMLDIVGQSNYESEFWRVLRKYDIVIVDSLPAILSHFRMMPQERRTEKLMVFDFIRESLKLVEECNNNIQLINQANKDGNYKGGTELPHMMSSLSFVKLDSGDRYIEFEKNRNNGKVKRRLYVSKTKDGDIEFNEEIYNATYKQKQDKTQSLDDFLNEVDLSKSEEDEMEMTAQEMGTGGSTQEEENEINENFNQ